MTRASWTAALRAIPVWLPVVAALGCAATPSGLSKPRTSLLEGLVTLVPHQSPARWVYHPRTLDLGELRVGTANETEVLLSRDGQRWLADAQGRLRGAEQVAPEPLIAASYTPAGRASGWHFLGRSGTTYQSARPLAPFLRVNAPPEELARVTAAAGVVLGVTTRGTLIRSLDAGATWKPVTVDTRVVDGALLSSGNGLLLTIPEGFWTTSDFGAHFKRQQLSPFGAMRVKAVGGEVRVEGTLTARRWSPQQPDRWLPGAPHVPAETQEFGSPLVRASAEAIRQHRAVLHEGRYAEIEERGGKLTLWRGAVSEVLEPTRVDVTTCSFPRLEGRGRVFYLVCGAVAGRVTRLKFLRSLDGGESWSEEPYHAYGDGELLHTAMLGDALLLTGTCPPEMAPSGCVPSGVYIRARRREADNGQSTNAEPAQDGLALVPVAVPGLRRTALDLSVSPNGETILVVGTRNKNDALVLFSSNDGGRTFRAEEVTSANSFGNQDRPSRGVEQTRWGQDGYAAVSVVDSRTTAVSLLIVNEHGEVIQQRAAPNAAARLAGAGLRAIAVEPRSGNAWESTDGGNRWQHIGELPVSLCTDENQGGCEPALVCHEQGCLLGEALSRIGWGGQQDVAYAEALSQPRSPTEIALQTPISCRVDDNAVWEKVPGGQLPDASRSSLGYVDWFTHHVDWNAASVSAYEVVWEGDGKAVTHVLFDAKPEPSRWVLYVTGQTEGVAALRAPADGAPVEVAWRDLNRGPETYRRKLPPAFIMASGATKYLARAGKPGLVSIAAGGVFVRLEENESAAQTVLLDHGSKLSVLPPLSWPTTVASGRTEMVQAEGRPVALKLFRGGATIVGAALDAAGQWQVAAFAAGLADPEAFRVRQSFDLAYLAGQPHYHLRHTGGVQSQAWLFPLRPFEPRLGEPIEVPTQRDLKGAGQPCSKQQRATTARVLAPPEADTLHPVVVTHSSEPFRSMITRTAVLYGSPAEPCLAGFDADSIRATDGEEIRALVRADSSQPSWQFRRLTGNESFEFRRMTCERDPELDVPPEVYELTGSNR